MHQLFINEQTRELIKSLNSQLDKFEAEMTNIINFNNSIIMTFPSIGYISAKIILSETDDIHRLSKLAKLLAFADMNLSIYQSSDFPAKITEISKHGFRVLQCALINTP